MSALVDHYKAVKARMGMVPPRPVVTIVAPKRVDVKRSTAMKPVRIPQEVVERAKKAPPSPVIVDVQKPFPAEARIPICAIQFAVCDYFRMSHQDLVGFDRKDKYTLPRHIAMWMCKKVAARSYSETARAFSNRDHTTVLYAVRRVEGMLNGWRDIEVATAIAGIRAKLFEDSAVYWGA